MLHTAEVPKEGDHIAVAMHLTQNYRQDLVLT
jgi:subtilisin-like proprotein convertase family protein